MHIKKVEISICYFSVVTKTITINRNGQFENFPDGFFEESFEEAMEMAELMAPEE